MTAGTGGELHEEAVSVTVSEAAIIRTAGNQSQTAYDDSDIKQRLTALESRQYSDTIYDDSDLQRRIAELESYQDNFNQQIAAIHRRLNALI